MSKQSSKEIIKSELNRIQFDEMDKYVLLRPVPFGLGAQIKHRIWALMVGLALERKVIFPFDDDPPYSQVFSRLFGCAQNLEEGGVPLNPEVIQLERVLVYDPAKISFWRGTTRRRLSQTVFERLQIPLEEEGWLEGAIFSWMPLVEEVRAACEDVQSTLQLGDDALGVHFRRGDKKNETAYVSSENYSAAIASMCETFGFKRVFLASDSDNAPKEINLPHGSQLVFDTTEVRYNNANHRMLIENPNLAKQETFTALKNIWLLSKCGGIVGQDNAHFAVIAATNIYYRRGIRTSFLIDGRSVEKENPWIWFIYETKRLTRKIAKLLLPWLRSEKLLLRKRKR